MTADITPTDLRTRIRNWEWTTPTSGAAAALLKDLIHARCFQTDGRP